MAVKLFCPLKTFSFINKYNFRIYVQLNYEMRFNADEEGPNMFKYFTFGIEKKFTCRGENSSNEVPVKFR